MPVAVTCDIISRPAIIYLYFSMDYPFSAKKIEQEEIIEHYVTESRRLPGTSGLRIPLQEILSEKLERRCSEKIPINDFRNTFKDSMQAVSSALQNEAERRFVPLSSSIDEMWSDHFIYRFIISGTGRQVKETAVEMRLLCKHQVFLAFYGIIVTSNI